MEFGSLVDALDGTLTKGKHDRIKASCPNHCGGELTVTDFHDDKPALSCSKGCSDDAIVSAINKLASPLAGSATNERKAGETSSPAAPHLNGHYSQVKTWIEHNTERAYGSILGHDLTRKAGSRELYSRCPLHDDRNPSMRINLEKTTWFCDPCGKGGGALKLAELVWGVDYKEATERFAKIAGVNGYARSNGKPKEPAAERTETRRLRYELLGLDGKRAATHLRIEYSDGSKSMPWEPSGIKPTELPLYGIHRTTELADGDQVILVEGEKCVDILWERDKLVAAGTSTGAGFNKPIPCDDALRPLLRLRVYLWADNDDVGRDHMEKIGKRLLELGHTDLWTIKWADAPDHGDAADYRGPLVTLIEDAEELGLYPDRRAVDALDAYNAMRADQREYSWSGLVRDGCTGILAALIGSGKTTLAMNIARGWALGGEVLGRQCRQSRTLAIISPKEYEAWADTIGFWELSQLIFLAPSTMAHFGDADATVRWFGYEMRRLGCRTFILDTLFDFFGMPPNQSGDSNRIAMNEQMPLLQFVREQNYSGLCTGHAPKSEANAVAARDPEEAFGGHTAWTAQHRMRMSIRRKSQGVNAFLTGRGGFGDDGILKEQMLLFDKDTRLVSLGGDFSEYVGKVALPLILDALKAEGWASRADLEKSTAKGKNFLKAGLREGLRDGSIKKAGNGRNTKYALINEPDEQATLIK